MYTRIWKLLSLFVLVFFLLFAECREDAFADNVIKIEDGALTFITNDTKAVSGTKWKTAGFTITDRPCLGANGNGGYPTKYNHATITIEQDEIVSTDMGNGIIRSKFYLPEKELSEILIKAGFGDTLSEGGVLYLNCIFQVTKNGVDYGPLLYDLNSIKTAQPWRNPDDFYDRFDIKVSYNGTGYPVVVESRLESGVVVSTKQTATLKTGATFNVAFDECLTYKKKDYELVTSYFTRNYNPTAIVSCRKIDFGYSLKEVRFVSGKMPIKGIKVVGIYREKGEDEKKGETIELEGGYDGVSEMLIGSNAYGKEIFDAKRSIPASEKLYVYANVPTYIYKGKIVKHYEKVPQKVKITIPYVLKWKEKNASTGEYKTVQKKTNITKEVTVNTDVSYWEVDSIWVAKAGELNISNELLGEEKIKVSNYKDIGDDTFDCIKKTKNYVSYDKTVKEVVLDEVIINGYYSKPDIPAFNYLAEAKKHVGKVYVQNDKLIIGKREILSNVKCVNNTEEPKEYNSIKQLRSISYKSGFTIPSAVKNSTYKSKANMEYVQVLKYNDDDYDYTLKLNPNSVHVHTPVCCDGKVGTGLSNSQLVNPDVSKPILVLDSYFAIKISGEGVHIDEKGYGYADYEKYTDGFYVVFPFDVKINSKSIKKGEMCLIEPGSTKVYLPSNVTTGKYQVKFYAKAINCSAKTTSSEKNANLDDKNYIAYDTVDLEVAGRVYNFSIYDISDYPLWEDVFRNSDKKLNGTRYRSGMYNYWKTKVIKNETFTLPLRNGSHPYLKNMGAGKTGYIYRMFVDTMGDYKEGDSIWITPTFYYVSEDGKTRKEVDLYYSETIMLNGKEKKYYFVKVGSDIDKKNIKYMDGDKLFTYGNIMVPYSKSVQSLSESSKQFKRWYFYYSLPSQIYMVDKNRKINKNEYFGENSSYIYKDGYLVVNFDIEVVKNKERYLSYENKINSSIYGCCNMWRKEGMPLTITDSKETVYNISYGDTIFFKNNENAGKDYISSGTH